MKTAILMMSGNVRRSIRRIPTTRATGFCHGSTTTTTCTTTSCTHRQQCCRYRTTAETDNGEAIVSRGSTSGTGGSAKFKRGDPSGIGKRRPTSSPQQRSPQRRHVAAVPKKQHLQQHHQRRRQNPWTLVSGDVLENETLRLIHVQQQRQRRRQGGDATTARLRHHHRGNHGPTTTAITAVGLDDHHYLNVLQAWIQHAQQDNHSTGGIRAARMAESLLYAMVQQQQQHTDPPEEDLVTIMPSLACHEAVLEAYATCHNGGEEAAERAELILNSLLQNNNQSSPSNNSNTCTTIMTPTVHTFNLVLQAWVNTTSQEKGERIERIRRKMTSSSSMGETVPDTSTIELEMQAWSTSGHPKAPERILQLLLSTVQNWRSNNSKSSNSAKVTTTVPSNRQPQQSSSSTAAATKTTQQQPPESVTRVVVSPTLKMFHLAMGALAKSSTHHHQRNVRQVTEQIEDLLQILMDRYRDWHVQPTLRTYMIVLGAWERVERVEKKGEAAQSAQNLLDYMIRSYESNDTTMTGSTIDTTTTNTPMAAVAPNTNSFACVMAAWCHADQPVRAEALYFRLVALFRTGTGTKNDRRFLPLTANTGNVVLAGWKHEPARILRFMKAMRQVSIETQHHPGCRFDLRTFNILLNALAKRGQVDDCVKLLGWLEGSREHDKQQQPNNNDGAVNDDDDDDEFGVFFTPDTYVGLEKPDAISYASLLEAFGKNGLVDKAEDLLQRMKRRKIRPTEISYTIIIHAYGPLDDANKVEKAYRIFQEVDGPDMVCVSAFLQVCSLALPPEHAKALNLAQKVYQGFDQRKRNEVVYMTMAKVIKNLVVWNKQTAGNSSQQWATPAEAETERRRLLMKVAKDCCETGHLSNSAWRALDPHDNSRTTESFVSWLRTGAKMEQDDLKSWSRNVPQRHRPYESTNR